MLPARRYRPRHAAPSTPATAAVPAGVLVSAAGAAFVGLSSSSTPSAASQSRPGRRHAPPSRTRSRGRRARPGGRGAGQRRAAQDARPRAVPSRRPRSGPGAVADRERDEQRREASAPRAPSGAPRPSARWRRARSRRPSDARWGRLHAGLDFGVPVGTPVRAVADGVVARCSYDPGGYGHYVKVRHADGTLSLYGHLSRVLVDGGRVRAGDVIARSGNTGHSTGPHLHFEMRRGGGAFDPRGPGCASAASTCRPPDLRTAGASPTAPAGRPPLRARPPRTASSRWRTSRAP